MLDLYSLLSRQWRVGMAGAVGLDMGVFLPVMESRRWDLDVALPLLNAIETAVLDRSGAGDGGEDPGTD